MGNVGTLSQDLVFQNFKLWTQLPVTCLVSYKELTQLVHDKNSKREVVVIIGKQELEKGNRCLQII